MFSFSFVTTQSKNIPLLLPITEEDIKKLPKKVLSPLTKNQKDALKTVLKKNVPSEGYLLVHSEDALLILLLLSKNKDLTTHDVRETGQQVFSSVSKWKVKELNIADGSLKKENLSAFREGVVLGSYEYNEFKGSIFKEKRKQHVSLEKLYFIGEKPSGEQKRLKTMLKAVSLTKNIINCTPAKANPTYLESMVRKITKELPKVKATIFKEKELKKMGCNGILAVGLGSHEQSRLLILEYMGSSSEKKPIVLVGKGVTYDTGGYSIKPSQYMETMKQDLGGAATVLGAFYAIAASGVKKNIIAVLPSVENSINSYAYRPDDVIKMYNGVTVEVTNTDAEGRVILGDALAYAAKKYNPSVMLDLATLTGACIYAVGNDFAAVMGTEQKLIDKIIETGKEVDELVWQLPLHQKYKKELESPIADIVNSSKMKAGTIEGALFLQHFVPEKIKWCHIDTAAVAFDEKKKMATGRDVRMLLELVKKL